MGFLSKILNYYVFIKHRRVYQRNWLWPIKPKNTTKFSFMLRKPFSSNVFDGITNENRDLLQKASKSGTWKFSKTLGRSRWQHKYSPFFPAIASGHRSTSPTYAGGIAADITSMYIHAIKDAIYFPLSLRPNGLNMFTFKLSQSNFTTRSMKSFMTLRKINNAISVEIGGANSFQHFSQDCLPLICFLDKKGILRDETAVLLPEPLLGHSNIRWLLTNLFPHIEFIFVSEGETLLISDLKVVQFSPRNYLFSLPQEMFLNMSRSLRSLIPMSPMRNFFIFMHRGSQKMRNLENLDEVEGVLNKIAFMFGLKYVMIDTTRLNIEEIMHFTSSAKVIFGIHGGSMYNAMLSPVDTVILEVVPTYDTNSLFNFYFDLGYRYFPIASEFSLSAESMSLSPNYLDLEITSILKRFLIPEN